MALELDDRQRAMLQEMGVRVWLPEMAAVPSVVVLHSANAVAAPQAAPVVPAARAPVPQPPARTEDASMHSLDADALAASAAACQACGLCAGRKNTTLQAQDVGRPADWLVLGDPPDPDEDRLGQAFAEQTGVLLDNMLASVGVSRTGSGRQGAYLSNVVKCRPPNARVPQADELAACEQYLQREIALVQPKVIVAMGRFAAQVLLQEHPQDAALPLGKQRGRLYRYRGLPVVVTYHPKVLLRAQADKAKAWADLCLAMDVLDGRATSLQ